MKIIYSAGNRINANEQLKRILENIKNHEIRVAAYSISSYSIHHIDWILDPIFKNGISNNKIFSHKNHLNIVSSIWEDVINFKPDLIISDFDPFFGRIANELNIPLWYCSPLNLILGTNWNKKHFYYYNLYYQFNNLIKYYPKAEKYLIYSPFCDLKNKPEIINKNYFWIRPYFNEAKNISIEENNRKKELNNILKYVKNLKYYFNDGNTNNISDAIYFNKNMISSPNTKNIEEVLNSFLINKYNIGYNIGQVELMNYLSVDEIEKINNKKFKPIELNNNHNLQLHEYIENEYSI